MELGKYYLNALRFTDFTAITASQAILKLLQTSKMARIFDFGGEFDFSALLPAISSHPRIELITSTTCME